jgi:thiol-disulfide isomerase/thioredoxin
MKLILATANFCGPCQLLKRKISDEKLEVEMVEMESNMDLFKKYNVKAVPRLLVVENDELKESIQGMEDIIKKIKEHATH